MTLHRVGGGQGRGDEHHHVGLVGANSHRRPRDGHRRAGAAMSGRRRARADRPGGTAARSGSHERCRIRRDDRHRRHRRHRVLQGLGALRAAAGLSRPAWPRSRTPASSPPRSTAWSTFTVDTNPEIEIARDLGIGELTFFSPHPPRWRRGRAAPIQQAAMAVARGRRRRTSSCYRAFNERSGHRFGTGVQDRPPAATAEAAHFAWYAPFGLLTPAQWVAMFAPRYMHEYGATSEDFGRVAVADRKHAANNPKAWFYEQPITLEDHQNSRWIVEPLHLLDCCQESDGGQALVVTTLERARDLQQPAGGHRRRGAGRRATDQQMMTCYYRDSITGLPEMGLVARQLCEHGRARPRRHPDRGHLRPLHALRAAAARGVRLLRRGARPRTSSRDGHIELGGAPARSTPTAASSARPTSTA